jgi:hypothetical protein
MPTASGYVTPTANGGGAPAVQNGGRGRQLRPRGSVSASRASVRNSLSLSSSGGSSAGSVGSLRHLHGEIDRQTKKTFLKYFFV